MSAVAQTADDPLRYLTQAEQADFVKLMRGLGSELIRRGH